MELQASYSRRVQLERYEPVEHGLTVTREVPDDADIGEEHERLAAEVEESVEREIARRLANKKDEEDDD